MKNIPIKMMFLRQFFTLMFPAGKDVQNHRFLHRRRVWVFPLRGFTVIYWKPGAGWKDTIGSIDLIVRLPYPVNHQNVDLTESSGYSETSPTLQSAAGSYAGIMITWNPLAKNNLQVSLVAPGVWQQILNEKANVIQNPTDGEAWGRLGKLYKTTHYC